jgi:hypothetical protein
LLNILVKEGFARSASTKERRCLKPFHKAKGEVIEELSQAQGVHLRCCKFTLQAQEAERETARRERRSPLKDAKELGTLEVFKPSKVAEESAQNSARSAERVSRTT